MGANRRCGFCEKGTLHLGREQSLRGAGTEGRWTCDACMASVKMLDAKGRLFFGVVTMALFAVVPYLALTEKVAQESQRWFIVAGVGVMAAIMAVLFLRDRREQVRHPWMSSSQ